MNGTDLGAPLLAWGPCAGICPADLSGDGLEHGADLGMVLLNWSS